ncbi:MAG: MBL fold metallo-hydrolase [Fervidicoccaceae archaeon]
MSSSRPGCVVLEYCGHSCFYVEVGDLRICLDPHDGESVGLGRPSKPADLVLVTHKHFDHDAVSIVSKPDSLVLVELEGFRRLKLREVEVEIEGFRAPHDRVGGRRRGLTSLYKLRVNGVTLIHAGDIGAPLSPDLIEKLSGPRPDFLMVPVGGFFTIEPYEAWELAELVKPVYVVPMHYWVPGSMLPLYPVYDFFLSAKTGRIELDGSSFFYCRGQGEPAEKTRILYFSSMATEPRSPRPASGEPRY